MNVVADSGSPGRLRFGIMCDSPTFETWQANIVEGLLAVDGVQLALVILNATPDRTTNWAKLARLRSQSLLYRAYRDFLFRPEANRPRDMGSVLGRAPMLRCEVATVGRYSQYFQEQDVSAIQNFGLDFIMRFGFNIIRGDILQTARFGVWSFHHDDEQKYRGGPPCFWEIVDGDPVTGVILQRLIDKLDGGIVLKKGYFPTHFGSYSKSFDRALLGSAGWPAAVCRDIFDGSAAYVDGSPSDTTAPIFHDPTNRQMIRFVGKVASSTMSRVWKRPVHSQ